MNTTIEIKGPGGAINYPTEVILKALREAGLQVEVSDEAPCPSLEIDRMITETKKRIDDGIIKDWKVVVRTTHYPWGG